MSRHKNAWQILRQMLAEQDRFYLYGPSGQPPRRPPTGLLTMLGPEREQALSGKEATLLIIDEFVHVHLQPEHGYEVGDMVTFPMPGAKGDPPSTCKVARVTRTTMTIEPVEMPAMRLQRDLPKQPNRGPQGHVENWKRRGRKGK